MLSSTRTAVSTPSALAQPASGELAQRARRTTAAVSALLRLVREVAAAWPWTYSERASTPVGLGWGGSAALRLAAGGHPPEAGSSLHEGQGHPAEIQPIRVDQSATRPEARVVCGGGGRWNVEAAAEGQSFSPLEAADPQAQDLLTQSVGVSHRLCTRTEPSADALIQTASCPRQAADPQWCTNR